MGYSVLESFKLTERVALIVGGNRGLGLAIANALAEAGAKIVIAARNKDKSEASAASIRTTYQTDCFTVACDVSDESSVVECVKKNSRPVGKDRHFNQLCRDQHTWLH